MPAPRLVGDRSFFAAETHPTRPARQHILGTTEMIGDIVVPAGH